MSGAGKQGAEGRVLTLKDEFPGTARGVWLDTAYQGLLPRTALRAGEEALGRKAWPGDLEPEDFTAVPARARAALAALLGGQPEAMALGTATSHGLHLVANGLGLVPGDEVLLFDDDFPATHLPWTGLPGVALRFRPRSDLHDPDRLNCAVGHRTRVACFAWVSSFTGDVVELARVGRLLRERGVIVVANVAQGAGRVALDLSTEPVDAVAGCGWKWLCGPYATGFLWTRQWLRERLAPNHRYWRHLAWTPEHPPRLSPDLPKRWPLDAFASASFTTVEPWIRSLELLAAVGTNRIEAHGAELLKRLRRGLLAANGVQEGSQVEGWTRPDPSGRWNVISPDGAPFLVAETTDGTDPALVRDHLQARGIHVSLRGGRLRFAPHIHNTLEDIDRTLAVLATFGTPSAAPPCTE